LWTKARNPKGANFEKHFDFPFAPVMDFFLPDFMHNMVYMDRGTAEDQNISEGFGSNSLLAKEKSHGSW
jgi:hypothetical protein